MCLCVLSPTQAKWKFVAWKIDKMCLTFPITEQIPQGQGQGHFIYPSKVPRVVELKNNIPGTFLVVQWLRLCTSTVGGHPGWKIEKKKTKFQAVNWLANIVEFQPSQAIHAPQLMLQLHSLAVVV